MPLSLRYSICETNHLSLCLTRCTVKLRACTLLESVLTRHVAHSSMFVDEQLASKGLPLCQGGYVKPPTVRYCNVCACCTTASLVAQRRAVAKSVRFSAYENSTNALYALCSVRVV